MSVGVAAYRGNEISRDLVDLRNGQQQMNTGIGDIEKANSRPIQINVPPIKVPPIPMSKAPSAEEVEAKKRMEFKIAATQLSTDILSYLSDRQQSGLAEFGLNDLLG